MPRIVWSRRALLDLVRLNAFLAPKSIEAAQAAVRAIRLGVKFLGRRQEIGRPVDGLSIEIREWVIEFGQSAYIVRYGYEGKTVTIVAIRHGREVGF
jgi:plasmid stabilization system protein ParE